MKINPTIFDVHLNTNTFKRIEWNFMRIVPKDVFKIHGFVFKIIFMRKTILRCLYSQAKQIKKQYIWLHMALYMTCWYNRSFYFNTFWFFVYFWWCAINSNRRLFCIQPLLCLQQSPATKLVSKLECNETYI